ncbi:isoprenylcysteine carboxylmethyltransferase family protein [Marinihelvus fidelis]|uniref:methanethiol S-methyltransferase n=1 Tax=Marinihelvus fidelis TaxID=2613842 RepID=A0A5N0TGD8_9GAMM|nr:methanethiol S-methyltransferase [Marinihelvus fidelis]KAA9133538.1 isoprenylcysteine carboxylmethyltransferase family protein [Marinihelvus fidelis]
MKRSLILVYGVLSYVIFFATFLYAVGFVGNYLVPVSIDGPPQVPLTQALLINLGLLTLFAVQHSLMARPFFKRWLTRYVPRAAERSTFVLASSLALIVLFIFWQPMGGVVWHVENQVARCTLHTISILGYGIVFVSTFLINHFDLFGLRQVWLNWRKREETPLEFGTPWLYRLVRHPLYLGFMIAFWAAPTMTIAHLVFALGCTGYILGAIQLEERDLADAHPEYRDYRRRVPMLIPRLGRRHKGGLEQTA